MFSEHYSKMLAKKKPRKLIGRGIKLGGKKPPLPQSGWKDDQTKNGKEPPEDRDQDDGYA